MISTLENSLQKLIRLSSEAFLIFLLSWLIVEIYPLFLKTEPLQPSPSAINAYTQMPHQSSAYNSLRTPPTKADHCSKEDQDWKPIFGGGVLVLLLNRLISNFGDYISKLIGSLWNLILKKLKLRSL